MKILFLNWKDIKHPQVGGAEIIVYEIAKRLVRDGHNVTWFCRSFEGAQEKEVYDDIKIIRKGNIATMYIHAPLYYWSLFEKPDLIIDMSNTIYWQSPLWAFWSRKIAYLNQLGQEVFDYEFNKLLAFCGKTVERIQYSTYKWMHFIVYSKSTKEDLISIGVNENRIGVFRLGVDHDRYKPGVKSKEPLFLCVSRLVKMKRTDLVIEAFRHVIGKHPKARLCIIGYGYDRNYLEMLRDKLGLEKNVFFLDEDIVFFKKNIKDQKIDVMQKSWALLFPSVKEGWGMTVTESAACGTPSIVTNVTGLRDSVLKDQTGLIVSRDPTPEEFSNSIIKIIEDQKLRERLSENAIKHSKLFTWENAYKDFLRVAKIN